MREEQSREEESLILAPTAQNEIPSSMDQTEALSLYDGSVGRLATAEPLFVVQGTPTAARNSSTRNVAVISPPATTDRVSVPPPAPPPQRKPRDLSFMRNYASHLAPLRSMNGSFQASARSFALASGDLKKPYRFRSGTAACSGIREYQRSFHREINQDSNLRVMPLSEQLVGTTHVATPPPNAVFLFDPGSRCILVAMGVGGEHVPPLDPPDLDVPVEEYGPLVAGVQGARTNKMIDSGIPALEPPEWDATVESGSPCGLGELQLVAAAEEPHAGVRKMEAGAVWALHQFSVTFDLLGQAQPGGKSNGLT